jgi:hypothetical protein
MCGYRRAGTLVQSYVTLPKSLTDGAGSPPDDDDGAWDVVVTPMPLGRQRDFFRLSQACAVSVNYVYWLVGNS